MAVPRVLDEMNTANLKDIRLNNRLREVLSHLGGHPTASIPAACGGHAEMTAAYRLFDNENAMIEVFFRVLKSGCRVQERQFENIDRLLSCLAVYLIVAWRTLYVCRLGRGCPNINCEVVFDPAEWKSVWHVIHKAALPSPPLRLGEMVRLVTQLGGYVNRKGGDPPGPQTIWIGMQRTHDFARCWKLFGPETRTSPKRCVGRRGLAPPAKRGRPFGASYSDQAENHSAQSITHPGSLTFAG